LQIQHPKYRARYGRVQLGKCSLFRQR
jgi:hypothetical protein